MSVIDITFPGNISQVATVSALRGVTSAYIKGDDLYYTRDVKALFSWDGSSLVDDDGFTIIRPNDITPLQAGRWILGLISGRFIQAGAGAVSRDMQDKERERVTPADFGAVGDGAINDRNSLAAADLVTFASGRPLVLIGRHKVSSNLTLRSDLIFAGGKLEPATGVIVTCTGIVTAAQGQIFAGAGSVLGIRCVRPEWWGAVGNGIADDLAALNAAHACVQASTTSSGDEQVILLGAKTYGVSATWKVNPTNIVALRIKGTGNVINQTRLTDIAAFSSITTPVLQIEGSDAAANVSISDWSVSGLTVMKGVGLATNGILIGSTDITKRLVGIAWSKVEDVCVTGFQVDYSICHVRQLRFDRCSSRRDGVTTSGIGFQITVNGLYTSDIVIGDDCEVEGNAYTVAGSKGVQLLCSSGNANQATGANIIGGIKIGADVYGSQRPIEMYCSNGGLITDVWAYGTQLDQFSNASIYVEANKDTATTPVIRDLHLNQIYFNQPVGTAVTLASTGTGGVIREVDVTNCYIEGCQNEFVKVVGIGVKMINVSFNKLVDMNNSPNSGFCIDLGQADGATCIGNKAARSDGVSTYNYLVRVAAGANNYVVANNVSGGIAATGVVLDSGGAVTKAVTGNI